jgi:hypothetical protein
MRTRALVLLVLCFLPLAAVAQHRDPLTDEETNKLRDTNYEPEKRIKLFLNFATARLAAVEQLRADPKPAADRGQRTRDLLQDFRNILDELSDNLDMYAGERHDDIRKSLAAVLAATDSFQLRLHALEPSAGAEPPAAAAEYTTALEDALDSVENTAADARDLLKAQEEAAAAAKKEKKR